LDKRVNSGFRKTGISRSVPAGYRGCRGEGHSAVTPESGHLIWHPPITTGRACGRDWDEPINNTLKWYKIPSNHPVLSGVTIAFLLEKSTAAKYCHDICFG
jgi:hypothetical protein